jgi:hypothetical protein
MPQNEKQPDVVQQRSLTATIAAVATPVAVVTAPVVAAWANQHFSEKPKDAAPPPQQPKND